MKKTTHSKSFIGWDTPRRTALGVYRECDRFEYLVRPYPNEALSSEKGRKAKRVKYTYTVTVEPIK